MRALLVVSSVVLLSACASGPYRDGPPRDYGHQRPPPVLANPGTQPEPDPRLRQLVYNCDDLTKITLTQNSQFAMARLNSGLDMQLARQPDPTGLRFGASPYEFRIRGTQATWESNGRVFRCG